MPFIELSATDIAAFVGAAAWLPPAAHFIHNKFSKAAIRIRADKYASIGFNSLGPIFNVRLALYTEVKKAVVNNIKITIVHEKGNSIEFECRGVQQKYSEILNLEGQKQVVGIDTTPLILVLHQDTVNDAIFRFQQQGFHDENSKLELELKKRADTLKRKNNDYRENNLLESTECVNYLDFIHSKFCWMSGNYEIHFLIEGVGPIKQLNSTTTMRLTQEQVDRLRLNLDLIKDELLWWMIKPKSPDERYPIMWNWLDIRLS